MFRITIKIRVGNSCCVVLDNVDVGIEIERRGRHRRCSQLWNSDLRSEWNGLNKQNDWVSTMTLVITWYEGRKEVNFLREKTENGARVRNPFRVVVGVGG